MRGRGRVNHRSPGKPHGPGKRPRETERGRPGRPERERRTCLEATFGAETGERRQRARIQRGRERIRTRAIGEENDD